jgi:hypothetical protein
MSFERQDQLVPILDHLEATDVLVFQSIQSRVLTKLAAQGVGHSSPAVALVFQGLRDALTQRGNDIVSEIRRVLDGSYVESVHDLSEELKQLLDVRLERATRLATAQYQTLASIRKSLPALPSMPSATGLFEHVETLKPPLFAEIELFCIKLYNSQAPELFLKADEVFAGNRAARSIFTAARKSLDIIDTYFGRIHTLREIVRTLSFDFEKKLMVETEGLAAAYPPMKFILYCTVCPSFKLLLNSCQLPEVL